MDFDSIFDVERPIIGMVHLDPLPGAPKSDADVGTVAGAAVRNAEALTDGDVDGIMIENFGDVPFYPDDVPKHTVASMTRIVTDVRDRVDCPVGVNVLRNDTSAAVSIAAATGCEFVRSNVHTGARVTVIEGRAHESIRLRNRLDAEVAVLADVRVKHSAPLATSGDGDRAASDTVQRGLSDGIVVSGRETGDPIDESTRRELRDSRGIDVPVLAGSGVDHDNVETVLEAVDGAIVGTAFKRYEKTTAPVDRNRVRTFMDRVHEFR